MKIKGVAVKSFPKFVEKELKDRYSEWFDRLPENSKEILKGPILATSWYSLDDAIVIPTNILADMYYDGDIKNISIRAGRFSAEFALTGIYKIFVKMKSAEAILKKASSIFATYYDQGEMIAKEVSKRHFDVRIVDAPKLPEVMEYRILGWMEKILEISGSKNIKIKITEAISQGSTIVVYDVTWE